MSHESSVTVPMDRPAPSGSFALPLRSGLGLKPEHFLSIISGLPDIGFFEIHAENYMVAGGPYHHYLGRIRERYALSLHGVGLSIGGETALDQSHLNRLATLIHRYEPAVFSEHLAWSSHGGIFMNDLLPIPYTHETLQRVCDHIDQIQQRLKRRLLLENPSTYVEFSSSSMSETEFICTVVKRTGCALLLDVNNAYVSCTNHQRPAWQYLDALPLHAVEEIHLAGFREDTDGNQDRLLIDSHDAPIDNEVWLLYAQVLAQIGPVPTLIERDGNIPPLDILQVEARAAEQILKQSSRKAVRHG